jgi:hypothetical protein
VYYPDRINRVTIQQKNNKEKRTTTTTMTKKSSSSSSEAGRPPSALKRVNPNSKFVSGGKNSEHEETHYSTEQYMHQHQQ